MWPAKCLWRAREILERLATAATSKEARVRRARPPATKPEHLAFATPLAECWRSITGTKAGKNPVLEKNPFLDYVTKAWVDVFGHDESRDDPQFIGALRSLSEQV